jgi:hypothetical protein
VDGSPNENGAITDVVDLILRYKGHTERATFAVTSLGTQDLILGLTWLEEHNPEIDWQTRQVIMSRCPSKCHLCQSEERKERTAIREQEREAEQIARLEERRRERKGMSGRQSEEGEEDEISIDPLEAGDRLYYMQLPTEAELYE